MKFVCSIFLVFSLTAALADDTTNNSSRDILVTFENHGAMAAGSRFGAPYQNRKRYAIATKTRQNATAVASEFALTQIDHWPIRSLSVYCFVYRIAAHQNRNEVISRLHNDPRVESVQALQKFKTGTESVSSYNDTYAGLQHGLDSLGIRSAHRYSLGKGVRVGVIDSNVDSDHEDLVDRVYKVAVFSDATKRIDELHGTAVVSVIGASANNEVGIVGVAPEASIELSVACWAEADGEGAVCDSFTLAKALDKLLRDPPDVLNLSLAGPHDPLLARLLDTVLEKGVIVVAADPVHDGGENFPAMHEGVIAVKSSGDVALQDSKLLLARSIFAPGQQIMVAVPGDAYEFRSGSSLAAAHVSGVIALLLARSPEQNRVSVAGLLRESQRSRLTDRGSVDACIVLHLADSAAICSEQPVRTAVSKLQSGS